MSRNRRTGSTNTSEISMTRPACRKPMGTGLPRVHLASLQLHCDFSAVSNVTASLAQKEKVGFLPIRATISVRPDPQFSPELWITNSARPVHRRGLFHAREPAADGGHRYNRNTILGDCQIAALYISGSEGRSLRCGSKDIEAGQFRCAYICSQSQQSLL
jgi:hypothetical protein